MKEEQDLEFQPTHPHACNVCLRMLFYFNTGVVKPQPMEHSCLSNSPTATKKCGYGLFLLRPIIHPPLLLTVRQKGKVYVKPAREAMAAFFLGSHKPVKDIENSLRSDVATQLNTICSKDRSSQAVDSTMICIARVIIVP